MSEYLVESKSRKDIRLIAEGFRELFNLENEVWVPIVKLLDAMLLVFDNFSYEIVPDDIFPPNIHAETDIRTGHIQIKDSVFERACAGEGRDRMTIAHEIGHFITLCFFGFKLQRNMNQVPIKTFNDPEWQAKCFAGELMVSARLTEGMSPVEIMKACGVSEDAATYQYNHRD